MPRFSIFCAQIRRDVPELFGGGFKVFDDFLGENVGVGQVIGVLETFVAEPEDVEAGLVAIDEFRPLAFPLTRVIIRHDSKAADRDQPLSEGPRSAEVLAGRVGIILDGH